MNKTATKRNFIVSTLALLIATFTSAYSQFIHEDAFPSMSLKVNSASLYPGISSLLIFGQTGAYSAFIDEASGYSVPFLFKRDSLAISPATIVPDTFSYSYWGFGGNLREPNYSLALDGNDNVLLCWSALSVQESDVPPTYLSKPNLRSALYSHGVLTNLFTIDSALNPQAACDRNNTAHVVWEKVTPLDPLPPSGQGMFTKYSSEIFYRTRSGDGTLSDPVSIGKGFSPQVLIAPDNSVHLLWFGADSSTAVTYQLMYRKSEGNSFSDPQTLQELSNSFSSFSSYRKIVPLALGVDSSNTVHYCWSTASSYPFSKFYVLHYNLSTGLQIDSSADYVDISIRFVFKSNGEVDAAWLSRTTVDGPSQFFYSSSAGGGLFSHVRTFSSIPVNGSFSLIKDGADSIHAMIWGGGEIQFIKNLPSGKDTLYSVPTGRLTVTSACLDRGDRVWMTGMEDSTFSLLSFPWSDIGKAPIFTFPLHIGNVWQYQDYMLEGEIPLQEGYSQVRIQSDTLMPNGRRYLNVPLQPQQPIFVRNDGFKTYQYQGVDSAEFVRYDFSKKAGDTVAIFHLGSETSAIRCTDIRREDIFGAPRSIFSFEDLALYGRDQVVDSVGILGYTDRLAWGYSLIGAIIDGVTYGTVLAVKEHPAETPVSFALYQNYPNPFNPTTRFQFTLAESRLVSLKVYDVLGREIATLVHEKKNAGNYSLQWYAGSYPSGVYFYRIQAGSFSQTKKMVLLK